MRLWNRLFSGNIIFLKVVAAFEYLNLKTHDVGWLRIFLSKIVKNPKLSKIKNCLNGFLVGFEPVTAKIKRVLTTEQRLKLRKQIIIYMYGKKMHVQMYSAFFEKKKH